MALEHTTNLFGARLKTLPILVLYLTDGCNSRCVMCDIWRKPRQNMTPQIVDELLLAAEQLKVRWIVLSGGEAMQHPRWHEIAAQFRALGTHVMLLTNGLYMQRDAERLGHVDELIVSLDAATSETYRRIRGVDALETVLSGIEAARLRDIPVTIRTTVQRENYHEIPQIIDLALTHDVNAVSFLPVDLGNAFAFGPRNVQPMDGVLQALMPTDVDQFDRILDEVELQYAQLFQSGLIAESPEKLRRLSAYFRAVGGNGIYSAPRCNAPHISTVVEVDGTVRPCYFLPDIGRMNEASLLDVLNSDAGQAMRQAYQHGKFAECKRCVCPLYKGPRSLWRM